MNVRRVFLAAVFVAALAGLAVAGPPVTVVLTNGQQFSGSLIYANGMIGVSNNGSVTNRWPVRDVAVIEFAPGTPDQQEIQQISQQGGSGNVLSGFLRGQQVAVALQGGEVVTGRLASISNDGNQVSIVDNQNQRDNYMATDIARLYLNPSAASTLYASNDISSSGAVGTSGQTSARQRSLSGTRAVRVNANSQWTPTGITVRSGDHLSFQATGQIRATSGGMMVGPDGGGGTSPNYPVPSADLGTLIGRVGTGQPFVIGARGADVTMPADGELYLGVNDDRTTDNSGTFVVRVGPANAALGTAGTTGQSSGLDAGRSVTVSGKQPWTPTGITVNAGDRLEFTVEGQVGWAAGASNVTGPAGGPVDPNHFRDYPVTSVGVGGLIGRIGDGQPFAIGAVTHSLSMPASGELFLGINDNNFGDNSGQFVVRVQRVNR